MNTRTPRALVTLVLLLALRPPQAGAQAPSDAPGGTADLQSARAIYTRELAVRRVRHADLHAALDCLNAVLGRHTRIAQDATHIIAQGRDLGAHQVLRVHLEEDVGAALQVEAEHDGAR